MECEIMIDQARALDNRRLRKQLGTIPRPILREVREKLRRLLDL
jgi:mRNA interferase MazF